MPDPVEIDSTQTERLFVALALPEPVRTALAGLAQTLPGVAWTRPAQLHVTLRFLGDVPASRMERMDELLSAVRVEPFLLPVEGLGVFPPRSPPRVLWAGVGAGHPRLYQLRQRLDDALLAAGLELDVRSFHPHVTVARCTERAAAAVSQWLRHHQEFAAPPFRVEAFDLCASILRPAGAEHALRHRYALTGDR
jgi:2'-5' RNA ligase